MAHTRVGNACLRGGGGVCFSPPVLFRGEFDVVNGEVVGAASQTMFLPAHVQAQACSNIQACPSPTMCKNAKPFSKSCPVQAVCSREGETGREPKGRRENQKWKGKGDANAHVPNNMLNTT